MDNVYRCVFESLAWDCFEKQEVKVKFGRDLCGGGF